MSEYTAIKNTLKARRGRKPLPPEERERRLAKQRADNRLRQEARRRALAVLQHRHAAEFAALYDDEYREIVESANTPN